MNGEILLLGMGAALTIVASLFTFWVIRGAKNNPRASTAEPPPAIPVDQGLPAFSATAHVGPEKIILRGLQDLLQRGTEGAFTVFEQRGGTAFVQFANTPAGLTLDIPLGNLSDEQRKRIGANFSNRSMLPIDEKSRDQSLQVYQESFGADLNRATAAALQIFDRVFDLRGDYSLYVKTE